MSANYQLQAGDKATYTSAKTGRKTHVIIISAERYPDGEAYRYTAHKVDDASAVITQSAEQFSTYKAAADTSDPKDRIAALKAQMAAKAATAAKTYRYVCLSCGAKTNRRTCTCGGDTILNTGADADPSVVLDH